MTLPTRETLVAQCQSAWLAWKAEPGDDEAYRAYLAACEALEGGPTPHPDELQEPHQWKNAPEPSQRRPDDADEREYPVYRPDQ